MFIRRCFFILVAVVLITLPILNLLPKTSSKVNIPEDMTTKEPSPVPLNKNSSSSLNLDVISRSFKECIDKQLNIEAYNRGYNELYTFFIGLGSVFGFIASDVRDKIDILEKARHSEYKEHYEEIESMMFHEMELNKVDPSIELLGSRTLLRLHRALKFTILLLEYLAEIKDDEKVSSVALTAYDESLANFHPWLIRNAAKLAMYSLPTRKVLIRKVGLHDSEEVIKAKIFDSTSAMNHVYEAVEELYTKHDLHGLP